MDAKKCNRARAGRMKPEDDAESMETLGWLILLAAMAPLALLFAS